MGNFLIFFFSLINILACNDLIGAAPLLSNETDRQALLAFKSFINDDPKKAALDSWNDSLNFCDWQGIICGRRHRRVVGMNISHFHLTGRIPPHIGNLSFLTTITLANNGFHGEIPTELGRLRRLASIDFSFNLLEGSIPAALSNCSHLESIQLYQNMLNGLPHELEVLLELTLLDLGGNKFSGTFPPFLTNLSSIAYFSLANNSFYGSIPENVGKLFTLEQLNLGYNSFSGELPSSTYNLSSITVFSIFQNQLTGRLSPDVGYSFPSIQELNLFTNHFTGEIPVSLCDSSNIQILELSDNNFVGSVPNCLGRLQYLTTFNVLENQLGRGKGDDLVFLTSLTNCTNLEKLFLGYNNLSGPIPTSISNLSENLSDLSLWRNHIHGPIPSGLGNLLGLQTLVLEWNLLAGSMPVELGKLQNLRWLITGHNLLSGQIPVSLGNLSNLIVFYSHVNHLQGKLPSSLGSCKNLQDLSLHHNNLSGVIPDDLFSANALIFLDLSNNLFDGRLPTRVGQLQNLNSFNVSKNKLSGKIPSSLGDCTSLVSLNLSFNSFEGIINKTLETLLAMERVDLSSNKLSGFIPQYFIKFKSILILNLSFNAFRGEVPLLGPFLNASKISVLGNDELCGGIFELHLPPCQKMNVGRTHHKATKKLILLKIILPVFVGIVLFLSASFVYISFLKNRSKNSPNLSSSIKKQYLQITYAQLHQATNGFSAANLIGSGSFGSVFKGVSESFGQMEIAIKVMNNIEHASLQGFISECEALKKIRHRNVVRILTLCISLDFQGNEFKALVFKFMKNGNLDSWLHPHSNQDHLYLSFSQRLDIAIDVATALDYLHNHCGTPIIHCDLKPSNILLDEDMAAQLTDFGLAKVLLTTQDNSSSCTSMLKGSIGYIPPEYGARYKVTPQGDIYSFGVLLLELFVGKRPIDPMFKDGINISKHVESCKHQGRLMEAMDQKLLQNVSRKLDDDILLCCFSSIIDVGIACTNELPYLRMNVSAVCSELQAVRAAYQKKRLGLEVGIRK